MRAVPVALNFLLRGIFVGFILAIPVGPIAILCIHQTFTHGRRVGMVAGLGAATADAIYGGIAGLGLTLISAQLFKYQDWLRLAGGIFLIAVGFRLAFSRAQPKEAAPRGHFGVYGSTLLLTLSNPLTIFSFLAIFASLGVPPADGPLSGVALLLGVFAGSSAWWLVLTSGADILRPILRRDIVSFVRRVCGGMIAACGFLLLLSLVLPR